MFSHNKKNILKNFKKKIYRGKQTADKFANSRDKFKPIRFDKFVLRFYMVQVLLVYQPL